LGLILLNPLQILNTSIESCLFLLSSNYLTLPYLWGEQSVKDRPSAHPRCNQGYYNLNEALANCNRLDGDILHSFSLKL